MVRLKDGASQQIVVLAHDGYLYVVDGVSGCADTVDIGEPSYSMALAEDVDSNGRLDLVVTTAAGSVYCFETPAQYHPLKTWPAQVRNGAEPRPGHCVSFACRKLQI